MLQHAEVFLYGKNLFRKTHGVFEFIKVLMETESSLLGQVPQRHLQNNCVRPRFFPALNSVSSCKQLGHFLI